MCCSNVFAFEVLPWAEDGSTGTDPIVVLTGMTACGTHFILVKYILYIHPLALGPDYVPLSSLNCPQLCS